MKKQTGEKKNSWLKSLFEKKTKEPVKTDRAAEKKPETVPVTSADVSSASTEEKSVQFLQTVEKAERETVLEKRDFGGMAAAAATNRGLLRPNNQDVYLLTPSIFGVADGMGGHNGGETASSGAKTRLLAILKEKEPSPQTLEAAVRAVNRHLYAQSLDDPSLSGMGTTLTMLWVDEKVCYVAHVGDSRAYLFRDGHLIQVTRDHSYVEELLSSGAISPEQAKNHPMKNIITRSLGPEQDTLVDIITMDRKPGDVWLICSDGLHGLVPMEKMTEIISKNDVSQSALLLMHEALSAGGRDNITMVIMKDNEGTAEK